MTTAMTAAIRRRTQIAADVGDGGKHVPNVLLPALEELGNAPAATPVGPGFREELDALATKDPITYPVENIDVLGVVGTLTEEGLRK